MYESKYNQDLQEAFEAGYRKALNEQVFGPHGPKPPKGPQSGNPVAAINRDLDHIQPGDEGTFLDNGVWSIIINGVQYWFHTGVAGSRSRRRWRDWH